MEVRIVVVGGGGVGKSALTVRFIQGNFVEKYDPTIEDSYRKQIDVDGNAYMLDVMDTAGQEEYSALRDSYMKTGQGFILAYDITSNTSFEQAVKLRAQIIRIKDDRDDIPVVLVGNKCDLDKERQVATEKASNLAKQYRMGFMEVSAKNNLNVNEMFYELVKRVGEFRQKHSKMPSTTSSATKGLGKSKSKGGKEKDGCSLQ